MRDDQSLARLLELAELVADLDQDKALGFAQADLRLLEVLLLRELVLLSPPIKDLPLIATPRLAEFFGIAALSKFRNDM